MKEEKLSDWLQSDFALQLLEHLPVSVFWKDRKGVYLGCNSCFARSVGLSSPQEVIGKTDYDLPIKKEDSDDYCRGDKQVTQSRQPKLNIEEEQTLLNGQKNFLLTSKIPVFNKHHDVIGVLGVYSNITDLKNAKQLEATNAAKSEFIANMSHDLRTPITGMLGLVQDMINTANAAEASLQQQEHSSVNKKSCTIK